MYGRFPPGNSSSEFSCSSVGFSEALISGIMNRFINRVPFKITNLKKDSYKVIFYMFFFRCEPASSFSYIPIVVFAFITL